MDTLTFISKIVESLSWPVASFLIAILLRKELGGLLSRIKKIKYNETEVELKEELEIAKEEASVALPEKRPTETNIFYAKRLAKLSPRGAVIEAWLRVEAALKGYSKRHGMQINEDKPFTIKDIHFHSVDYNGLGKGILSMLGRLRTIRNNAVHLVDSEIETKSAIEYIELADRVIQRIEEA